MGGVWKVVIFDEKGRWKGREEEEKWELKKPLEGVGRAVKRRFKAGEGGGKAFGGGFLGKVMG